MEVYGRVFDENCTYKVVPYKGIERMLETLKKQGIRLAVLSNKPDRQVGHVIREIFGEGLFDWIQGQKEGVPRKPDPVRHLTLRTDWELRSQRQRISEIRKWILQRESSRHEDDPGILGIPWKKSTGRRRGRLYRRFG